MIVGPEIPSNLRQIIQQKLKQQGLSCSCIRCREIRNHQPLGEPKLKISTYPASGGQEHFIEFIDQKDHCLGFLRLRVPAHFFNPQLKPIFPYLKKAALIRELHIYGPAVPLQQHSLKNIQHQGLGRRLVQKAEKIARRAGAKKLAIIAGVGVRDYYRRFGYRLKSTYMIRQL